MRTISLGRYKDYIMTKRGDDHVLNRHSTPAGRDISADPGRQPRRNGRPALETPGAPLAWLTIDLVAQAPAAGGFRLIEVEHQAIARLGYQMPVEGAAQAGAPVQSDQPTLWYELGALQPSAPSKVAS